MIVEITDVDALAQIIRRVDGSNKLGAGALAEAIIAALSPAPQAPAGGAEREAVNELAAVLEAACWQGSFRQLARAAVAGGWLSPSHAREQAERIEKLEAECTRSLALLAQARAVLASVDAKHPGGLAGQIVSRIDNETVARVFAALAEGDRDNG